MKEANFLKAFEVLAGRISELETELSVSSYKLEKLKGIIERAEKEAAEREGAQ